MKTPFSKLALIFVITIMVCVSTSCSSDHDTNDPSTKEHTYYITTNDLTIDAGAPFTKEQLEKQYNDAMYTGCEGKSIYDKDLCDVIQTTYKKQEIQGWTKYIHGSACIMCHTESTNSDISVYRYDVDTDSLMSLLAD